MKVRVAFDTDNEILFERTIEDDETLDCNAYADEAAEMYDFNVDHDDGHVPLGCADFTVTLADDPDSVVCWAAQSYFIASDG